MTIDGPQFLMNVEGSGKVRGILLESGTGTLYIANTTITINANVPSNPVAIYNHSGSSTATINPYTNSTVTNSNTSYNGYGLVNNTGVMNVRGGTTIGKTYGVHSVGAGTLTIGNTSNADVSTGSPAIQGGTYGVHAASGFKFYDGKLKNTLQLCIQNKKRVSK